MSRTVTEERIEDFRAQLRDHYANAATVEKYASDVGKLAEYLKGGEVTQERLDDFGEWLVEEKNYKKSSANAYIISARVFFRVMNWDYTISGFSIDTSARDKADKYISRADYQRLLTTAMYLENYRLAMVIQTLCHMDIRYSELGHMTVEAVNKGYVELKRRKHTIRREIPGYLKESLLAYAMQQGISRGVLFRTSGGNMPNRSNIWKSVKRLCGLAGVDEDRVTLAKLKMPMVHDYYPFYPMVGKS